MENKQCTVIYITNLSAVPCQSPHGEMEVEEEDDNPLGMGIRRLKGEE